MSQTQERPFITLLVTNDGMGKADETLRHKLIRTYFQLLEDSNMLPNVICFYTEGVRLVTGDSPVLDLLQALERKGVTLTIVLACVGSLRRAVLRFANQSEASELEGKFEIVSLTGTLSKYGSHYHISISDGEGRTWARFADRVIALADGQIVLDGAPQDVLASPLLEQHHIRRTRYTQVAVRAQTLGLARNATPLPVTLEAAVDFFRASGQ